MAPVLPSATLLSTRQGMSLLRQALQSAGPASPMRIEEIESRFAEDIDYVEQELGRACTAGESPGVDAARHLVASGGKRARPLTVLLAASCFGPVPEAARQLAVVAELMHSATLLHDDVIDDAPERRGQPTAKHVLGNAVSVLGGDLLLSHALDRTLAAAPAALPSLLIVLRRLVDGEILQLRGRTELILDPAICFRIMVSKTASLFGWAASAGGLVAGASPGEQEALRIYGEALGVAFQLVDDLLDYVGNPESTGKSLLGDLAQGKVTLPLVLACERRPELIEQICAAKAGDLAAVTRLGQAVRASGACEQVRHQAAQETERAQAALQQLRPSRPRDLLWMIAMVLAHRDS